jgi:GxxExxY protein
MHDSNIFDADSADYADYADERSDGADGDQHRKFPHRDITGAVIGGMYVVHGELGSGFLEGVYANALSVVLRAAGLMVEREVPIEVVFHGERVGWYRADMIVEGKVLVEVKTGRRIHPRHRAQVLNYLRATGREVGLVLNFGRSAEAKRVVSTRHRHQPRRTSPP